MSDYRSLTVDEIEVLEANGCYAEDWTGINVAEDFVPTYIRNVGFYGSVSLGVFDKPIEVEEGFYKHSGIANASLHNVTVGDNCLIENIGNYINNYVFGEECYIANVGLMTTNEGTSFGQGIVIPVLNEAGEGNVIIYDQLTSQMAALMVEHADNALFWNSIKDKVNDYLTHSLPECGTVGYRVKIVNSTEIINVLVGDDCEVSGASRLADCSFVGNTDASVYVGNDVICENVVCTAGSSILSGAKLSNCFVGEACHVGKGFSADNCVIFANSYLDNGEACAAFCGPFTVSHHKSTLLIGGQYSFYNAGSNTNYSNHAYKIGPVHWGVLERGSKTASGAHLLMPVHIGTFSMCMGKIQNHPDTQMLPFSYVIASGDTTYIVPGRNFSTVGTYRDITKWESRDKRPHSLRQSLINFEWLNPHVINEVIKAKQLLLQLRKEQGENVASYVYEGCVIKNHALLMGIQTYDMAIRMFMGAILDAHALVLPKSSVGTGDWLDLSGFLLPESEEKQLVDDIINGSIADLDDIQTCFEQIHREYANYCWNYAYRIILDYYHLDTLTEPDVSQILNESATARKAWINAVRYDVEKEYAMGDVKPDTLNKFLSKLEKKDKE